VSHNFSTGRLIMMSSPKQDIIKGFVKGKVFKRFIMPAWEEDELLDCHKLLYENIITELLLKEKFKLYGGIVRWIFEKEISLEDNWTNYW